MVKPCSGEGRDLCQILKRETESYIDYHKEPTCLPQAREWPHERG